VKSPLRYEFDSLNGFVGATTHNRARVFHSGIPQLRQSRLGDRFQAAQIHVRTLRAIEVLEHVDSVEARDLLRALSTGAPAARLTLEAKSSLERLQADASRK